LFKQIQTEKEPIIFDHEVEQEVQTAPRVLSLNDLANLDAAEIADEEEEVQGNTETSGRESVQDKEINEIIQSFNALIFSQPLVTAPIQPEINGGDSDSGNSDSESRIYDLTKGAILKVLNISMGSTDLPRFQCACHKLNIAVRTAISNNKEITDILEKLCRENRSIRKSIQVSQVCRNLKSKLRLPNAIRWSSAFLMLESVKSDGFWVRFMFYPFFLGL